jgi:predicted DNA-binding protein (MmcQ/YjbR family)
VRVEVSPRAIHRDSYHLDYLRSLHYPTAMDIDRLRKLLAGLPGATEQIQWEHNLVFKVGGKMFAVAPLESMQVQLCFKCSDEDFADLIERPGIIPAPYLARAHWVALESESALPGPELERLLHQAHSLIVAKLPKKLQARLLAPRPKPRKARPKHGAKRIRTRKPTP